MSAKAIWVEVIETRGSAPRDAGTAMKVTASGSEGTIGGGALEHRAMQTARAMLADGTAGATRRFALGPSLGQCCGGAVTLRFGRAVRAVDPVGSRAMSGPRHRGEPLALWLWGAGHVGRAVVQASDPQGFDITWIDMDLGRFPAFIPTHVSPLPAMDMPRLAARAPRDAHHLIFTYSHDIDFDLCHALLQRGAGSIGLIGSATKRARFRSRLRDLGHAQSAIDRIDCPIGDPGLGKRPQDIATGVIAALRRRADALAKEDVG